MDTFTVMVLALCFLSIILGYRIGVRTQKGRARPSQKTAEQLLEELYQTKLNAVLLNSTRSAEERVRVAEELMSVQLQFKKLLTS